VQHEELATCHKLLQECVRILKTGDLSRSSLQKFLAVYDSTDLAFIGVDKVTARRTFEAFLDKTYVYRVAILLLAKKYHLSPVWFAKWIHILLQVRQQCLSNAAISC
jgi:hypothetical protein